MQKRTGRVTEQEREKEKEMMEVWDYVSMEEPVGEREWKDNLLNANSLTMTLPQNPHLASITPFLCDLDPWPWPQAQILLLLP